MKKTVNGVFYEQHITDDNAGSCLGCVAEGFEEECLCTTLTGDGSIDCNIVVGEVGNIIWIKSKGN